MQNEEDDSLHNVIIMEAIVKRKLHSSMSICCIPVIRFANVLIYSYNIILYEAIQCHAILRINGQITDSVSGDNTL